MTEHGLATTTAATRRRDLGASCAARRAASRPGPAEERSDDTHRGLGLEMLRSDVPDRALRKATKSHFCSNLTPFFACDALSFYL